MGPERLFAALVERFGGRPGVTTPAGRRGFGSSALKVNGSIFAMLSGGRLVVKLPRQRVDDLIETGSGNPFDAGKGKPMKEWLKVTTDDGAEWLALAGEAHDFVASSR